MAHPSVRERTQSPQKTTQKPAPESSSATSGIGLDHGIPTVRATEKKLPPEDPEKQHIHPAAQGAPKTRQPVTPHSPTQAPVRKPAAHPARPAVKHTKEHVQQHAERDPRFQHELQEMQETHDLRDVDDDVEDVATLFEWRAEEHNHQLKSAKWYAVLAASITVVTIGLALLGNFFGAITIAIIGSMVYYIAQKEPSIFRYRLMTEGVAFNNTLYHYRDLESFNIIYEPGHTKTMLLRSKRTFAPLLHMEIGDADPVAIRDIMIEFVYEDQDMTEPLVDIFARRLGF